MSKQLKQKRSVKRSVSKKNRSCVMALDHLDHTSNSMAKMMTISHCFDESTMSLNNKQHKNNLIHINQSTTSIVDLNAISYQPL